MARAKNQARRSGRSSGTPGWVWLIAGLLMGGVVFGYLQFKDKWGKPASTLPQPDPQAQARVTRGEEVAPDKPKPKYDFYTLLPEKEVVIPDAELDAQARAEAAKPPVPVDVVPSTTATGDPAAATVAAAGDATPTAPAASNEGPRYLIQAGAFRGSTEAEALKAKIALTGEIARVEVAQINGNTVHRVRMGPYPNASALAAAKAALASHGITAQAIKVK
jgi:cell division protein FtsN